MDFLRQLVNGIAQAWQQLSLSARINIVLASIATVAAIAVIVIAGGKVPYVRLYEGLNVNETSKILAILDGQGVPYKIEDDGQSILVPQDKLSDMRLAVGSQGLPKTQGRVPGFELFDDQDLMTNQALQDVKYMRAVQGELQRQLNAFSFVDRSFVFIREAKEELFTSEQQPSQASVSLDIRRPLSEAEIDAVLHTISSFGGAYLSTDNITLTTTDGHPLHLPPTSEFVSIARSKLDYVAKLERQREQRVLKDFEQLGLQAIVKVSAVVDFDSLTETISKSEEGPAISSYTSTLTTSSTERLPQGAPGAVANIPEGEVSAGATETVEESEETVENYQPGTTTTETVREPGRVERYIVCAMIEGKTETTTDADGNEVAEYAPLTQEQVKKYEDYIAAAVGEGDTPTEVTVYDHPFDVARLTRARAAFEEMEEAARWDLWYDRGRDALWLLGIILGLWISRRFLRRVIVVRLEEEEGEMAPAKPEASPEVLRREEIFGEVTRMSEQEPEAVAGVLRTWLSEEEE